MWSAKCALHCAFVLTLGLWVGEIIAMALKAMVCTRAQTATTHVASPTMTVTEPSICIAGSVSALVSRRTDGTARGACPSTKRRLKATHELSNSTAMGKRKKHYETRSRNTVVMDGIRINIWHNMTHMTRLQMILYCEMIWAVPLLLSLGERWQHHECPSPARRKWNHSGEIISVF